MALDYSKWDNLELSDDSDIEVHPNVDKRSMIKWKREAIHREREERNRRIEYLEHLKKQQNETLQRITTMDALIAENASEATYEKLNEQSKQLLSTIKHMDLGAIVKEMVESFAKGEQKLALETAKQKVEKSMTSTDQELQKLQKEANKKMTSENMFQESSNRTIISKPKQTVKKKETVIETLNPGVQMKDLTPASQQPEDDDENYELTVEAAAFCRIKDFGTSYKFIQEHNDIINQNSSTSDSILAEAFTAQLKGQEEYAKNCVQQATILSYCELDPKHVTAFFKRMETPNDPRCQKFFEEVSSKYQHIQKRCAIILQENASREVETIQLQPMNPGSRPTVRIPDATKKEEQEAYKVYHSLPEPFRKALETADLDIINKALETIDSEEAEGLVEICSNYGFLDVDGGVVDETGAKPHEPEERSSDTNVSILNQTQ